MHNARSCPPVPFPFMLETVWLIEDNIIHAHLRP